MAAAKTPTAVNKKPPALIELADPVKDFTGEVLDGVSVLDATHVCHVDAGAADCWEPLHEETATHDAPDPDG